MNRTEAVMWTVKHFPNATAQQRWIGANEHRYQITVLFVNNGYAVEWRALRRAY
jgi:hypothetical protein